MSRANEDNATLPRGRVDVSTCTFLALGRAALRRTCWKGDGASAAWRSYRSRAMLVLHFRRLIPASITGMCSGNVPFVTTNVRWMVFKPTSCIVSHTTQRRCFSSRSLAGGEATNRIALENENLFVDIYLVSSGYCSKTVESSLRSYPLVIYSVSRPNRIKFLYFISYLYLLICLFVVSSIVYRQIANCLSMNC